jgi:hypothetical protein
VVVRLAIAAILAFGLETVTDRQSQTVALPEGRSLALDVTIGAVRILGEPRADALIEIVRTAPTHAALARIPVKIDQTESMVHVVAVQQDGGTDASLKTDVTLRVPHAATVGPVRVLEGRLTLAALRGRITADVRRGPIEAMGIEGTVRLETGIGNVIADRVRLSPQGLLRLRAFNGDIRLTLVERPPDARVMALALNGTIRSDIPLRTKDTWGPRWAEATIGKGEPVISLDVITGLIEIKAP